MTPGLRTDNSLQPTLQYSDVDSQSFQPFDKQNSLVKIAQNLNNIKSFNPTYHPEEEKKETHERGVKTWPAQDPQMLNLQTQTHSTSMPQQQRLQADYPAANHSQP